MAKIDFPITQLHENAIRPKDLTGQSGTTTSNVDVATDITAGNISGAAGNYGEIPAGDIAGVERVMLTFNITTVGKITFPKGDYGPGIRSSLGDLEITFAAGETGRRTIVVESSRLVREDGTVRIRSDGTLVGSLTVLAMPRSLAGRAGQAAIPPNPKAY